MKIGDKVVCRGSHGYLFTAGKTYEVAGYEAEFRDIDFTWPAYVSVIDDEGKQVWCHAHRFEVAA